ncbi:ubiquitin carboxyl-terminal hydrolase faf-x-related [Anaeramoeba flamelloides]|uniref:Ubiquitin carboxyl-terminal hydrolase faf-x-related n=1 Tax=Anaeramoeba flamelloides TaxID=1746091 RepID=A0AAV7ZF94_9EUKA|nr:ubiquitin carboxyl-terminal hydrolase faf-x-related [Anaeramoeba flamelloides]
MSDENKPSYVDHFEQIKFSVLKDNPTKKLSQFKTIIDQILDSKLPREQELYFYNSILYEVCCSIWQSKSISKPNAEKSNEFLLQSLRLISERLSTENSQLLITLAKIFALPKKGFYSIYDESPKTKTFSTEQNDTFSIIDQKLIGAVHFRKKNINYFYNIGGFHTLLLHLTSNEHKINSQITLQLLEPIIKISHLYKVEFLKEIEPSLKKVLVRILNCKYEQLKHQNFDQLILISSKIFKGLKHLPTQERNKIRDKFILDISLKYITSPYLDMRVSGIERLQKECRFLFKQKHEEQKKKKKNSQNQSSLPKRWINSKRFLIWGKQNKLINILFGEFRHPKILNQTCKILEFYAINNKINNDELDLIWNASKEYQAISEIIYEFLLKIIKYLSIETIKYLFIEKFQEIKQWDLIQINFLGKVSLTLLDLLSISKNYRSLFYKLLNKNWQLIINPDLDFSLRQIILNNFKKLFVHENFDDRFRKKIIEVIQKKFKIGYEMDLMIPLFENILLSFPDCIDFSNQDEQFNNFMNSNKVRETIISELNKEINFYMIIIEDLENIKYIINKYFDENNINVNNLLNKEEKNEKELKFGMKLSFYKQLKIRFSFLNFLYSNSELEITINEIEKLYNLFIIELILPTIESNFFYDFIIKIEPTNELISYFYNKVKNINNKSITESEFKFFKHVINLQNKLNKNIKINHNKEIFLLNYNKDLKLIGIEKIWEIIINSENEEISKLAIHLLIQYQNLPSNKKNYNNDLIIINSNFLKLIFQKIKILNMNSKKKQFEDNKNNNLILNRYLNIINEFKLFYEQFIIQEELGFIRHKDKINREFLNLKINYVVNKNEYLKFNIKIRENNSFYHFKCKLIEKINYLLNNNQNNLYNNNNNSSSSLSNQNKKKKKFQKINNINIKLNNQIYDKEHYPRTLRELEFKSNDDFLITINQYDFNINNNNNKDNLINYEYLPSFILKKYFQDLFKLIESTIINEGNKKIIWELIMLLPTNEKILYELLTFFKKGTGYNINWQDILNKNSIYKLNYNLQIINDLAILNQEQLNLNNKMNNNTLSVSTFFNKKGGLKHLIQLISEITFEFLHISINDDDDDSININNKINKQTNTTNRVKENYEKFKLFINSPKIESICLLLKLINLLFIDSKKKILNIKLDNLIIPKFLNILMEIILYNSNLENRLLIKKTHESYYYSVSLIISACNSRQKKIWKKSILEYKNMRSWIIHCLILSPNENFRKLISLMIKNLCQYENPTNTNSYQIYFIRKLINLISKINEFKEKSIKIYNKEFFNLLEEIIKMNLFNTKYKITFDQFFTFLKKQFHSNPFYEENPQIIDNNLIGYLKILLIMIKNIPTFKLNSLELTLEVFNQLFNLKLKNKFIEGPKLKNNKSRLIGLDLLYELIHNNKENLNKISKLFYNKIKNIEKPETWYYSIDFESKKINQNFLGLKNLSNTCYMNSLLQQFFMIPQFREKLFSLRIPTTDINNNNSNQNNNHNNKKKNNIDHSNQNKKKNIHLNHYNGNFLYQLQLVFANLLVSKKKYVNTLSFAKIFLDFTGQPIDLTKQMDVYEFLTLFLSHLENNIKSNSEKKLLKNFFGGKLINQIIIRETGKITERIEDFTAISLDVENKKNLFDSLDQYVQIEELSGDNQIFIKELNKKANINKRSLFLDLPKNLILHLKRFEWDFKIKNRYKINSKYKFPLKLDMYKYTKDYFKMKYSNKNYNSKENYTNLKKMNNVKKKCYEYELTGIIVHRGTSNRGHYYSFIKDRTTSRNNNNNNNNNNSSSSSSSSSSSGSGSNLKINKNENNGNKTTDNNNNDNNIYNTNNEKWYRFDDKIIKEFDPENIKDECFGGKEEIIIDESSDEYERQIIYEEKNYSAYILIYQRIDTINKNLNLVPFFKKKRINKYLMNEIQSENSKFQFRNYIFEEQFLKFLQKVIKNTKFIKDNNFLQFLLIYFIKIFSYSKFKNKSSIIVQNIINYLKENVHVSKWFLTKCKMQWFEEILLNCPIKLIRKQFIKIFTSAMIGLIPSELKLIKDEIKKLKTTNVNKKNNKYLFNKSKSFSNNLNKRNKKGKTRSNSSSIDGDDNDNFNWELQSNSIIINYLKLIINFHSEPLIYFKTYYDYLYLCYDLINSSKYFLKYFFYSNIITKFTNLYYEKINKLSNSLDYNENNKHQFYYIVVIIELIIKKYFTKKNNNPIKILSAEDKLLLFDTNFLIEIFQKEINLVNLSNIFSIFSQSVKNYYEKTIKLYLKKDINNLDFKKIFQLFNSILEIKTFVNPTMIKIFKLFDKHSNVNTNTNIHSLNNNKKKYNNLLIIDFLQNLKNFSKNKVLVRNWLLDNQKWLEKWLIKSNSKKIQRETSNLLKTLIEQINEENEIIIKLFKDLFNFFLNLLKKKKKITNIYYNKNFNQDYFDEDEEGCDDDDDEYYFNKKETNKNSLLIQLLQLLTLCLKGEKTSQLFAENFKTIWKIFLIIDNYNEQILIIPDILLFIKKGFEISEMNFLLLTEYNDKRKKFDNFTIIIDHSKKQIINYNKKTLLIYFQIIKFCIERSQAFEKFMILSETFRFSLKNIILVSQEYQEIENLLIKIIQNNFIKFNDFRTNYIQLVLKKYNYLIQSPFNTLNILSSLLVDFDDKMNFLQYQGYTYLTKFLIERLDLFFVEIDNENNFNNKETKNDDDDDDDNDDGDGHGTERGGGGDDENNKKNDLVKKNFQFEEENKNYRINIELIELIIKVFNKSLSWINKKKKYFYNSNNSKDYKYLKNWTNWKKLIKKLIKPLYYFEKNHIHISKLMIDLIYYLVLLNKKKIPLILSIFLNDYQKYFFISNKKSISLELIVQNNSNFVIPRYFINAKYLKIMLFLIKYILNSKDLLKMNFKSIYQLLIHILIQSTSINADIDADSIINNDNEIIIQKNNNENNDKDNEIILEFIEILNAQFNSQNINLFLLQNFFWRYYLILICKNLKQLKQHQYLKLFSKIIFFLSNNITSNEANELLRNLCSILLQKIRKIKKNSSNKKNFEQITGILRVLFVIGKNSKNWKHIIQKNFISIFHTLKQISFENFDSNHEIHDLYHSVLQLYNQKK